jgi:succinoglycan biosynthesis protein ExoA
MTVVLRPESYSSPTMVTSLPGVTYVMPVLNEQTYVESAVATVLDQHYPGATELILALGPSTDETPAIVERLTRAYPNVSVVDNPAGDVSSGLNLAIGKARHRIIARVDAHTALPAGYTEHAVRMLQKTGAAAVGAVMVARGEPGIQAAAAKAYNSPYGLGGGAHHRADALPGPTESAYLGVMRVDAFTEVGGFDTSLRRGQDWELNFRLRKAGHLVWIDPALRVDYWPRASTAALRRQMYATGIWRGEIVRRVRAHTPIRYFAPPALVASGAVTLLLALAVLAVDLHPLSLLPGVGPAAYLGMLIFVAARGSGTIVDRTRVSVVLVCMHSAWGLGFLRGVLWGARDAVDTSRLGRRAPEKLNVKSNEIDVIWARMRAAHLTDVYAGIPDVTWDLELMLE